MDIPAEFQSPPLIPTSGQSVAHTEIAVAPQTLDEMMLKFSKGKGISYSFDVGGVLDNSLTRVVKDGDFSLNYTDQESLIATAQSIRDMAIKLGIKLEDIAELKAAMNYDQNPNQLSDQELGAYLLAKTAGKVGNPNDEVALSAKYFAHGGVDAVFSEGNLQAVKEIGQQIFGDNHPEFSSLDTVNHAPKSAKIGRTK